MSRRLRGVSAAAGIACFAAWATLSCLVGGVGLTKLDSGLDANTIANASFVPGTSVVLAVVSAGGDDDSAFDTEGEAYWEVAGTIVTGVFGAIIAFRKLKRRGRLGRNIWLAILFFSFVLCAYGFGFLLELAAA